MTGTRTIVAMIPARYGSERLPKKNLILLDKIPLIAHVIQKVIDSQIFDKIVVNGDHDIFGEIADNYKVEFYKRPALLATSTARSDDVIYDFIKKHSTDILAWINPIAPLQSSREICDIVKYFISRGLDSLVTVRDQQVHGNFRNKPLNYSLDEKFLKTQDLDPVQIFVYSIMMWNSKVFVKEFEKKGYGLLCGKRGFYPVSWRSSIIIKYKEDIQLCESLLRGDKSPHRREIKYYQSKGDEDHE